MRLYDGRVVHILSENVSQPLEAFDLALHVLAVLLLYRYSARVLYLGLEHFELGDPLHKSLTARSQREEEQSSRKRPSN